MNLTRLSVAWLRADSVGAAPPGTAAELAAGTETENRGWPPNILKQGVEAITQETLPDLTTHKITNTNPTVLVAGGSMVLYRYVVPAGKSGLYFLTFNVRIDTGGTSSQFAVYIQRTGDPVSLEDIFPNTTAFSPQRFRLTTIVDAEEGDEFIWRVHMYSGVGTIAVHSDNYASYNQMGV